VYFVPEGTIDNERVQPSLTGLVTFPGIQPGTEGPGYFQPSLTGLLKPADAIMRPLGIPPNTRD
jgi:hypothetical protein